MALLPFLFPTAADKNAIPFASSESSSLEFSKSSSWILADTAAPRADVRVPVVAVAAVGFTGMGTTLLKELLAPAAAAVPAAALELEDEVPFAAAEAAASILSASSAAFFWLSIMEACLFLG